VTDPGQRHFYDPARREPNDAYFNLSDLDNANPLRKEVIFVGAR